MVDMAPELLQQIQSDWSDNLKNDAEIKSLIEKINEGKATYKEVEDLSYRVGKDLSKSLLDNITEDILPNGHVPQNVAEKILHPTLNNAHNLVTNVAVKVQEDMNEAAGIGLKAQKTDYNEEKAQGLVHKLTNGQFEDTKWILDEPVTLFVQSVADNPLKKNVDFRAHSGLKPQIIRKASSNCCSWCSDLEGTYDYGSEPKDVYRRHERCKCSVDYNPGNGKRQDVWSKAWHDDVDKDKIEERVQKSINREADSLTGNIGKKLEEKIAWNNTLKKLSTENKVFYTVDERTKKSETVSIKDIIKDLNRTEVGRDTISLINTKKPEIILCYGINNKDERGNVLYGKIYPDTKTILIFADETKNLKKTSETIIHEVYHLTQKGSSQKNEVQCRIREKMHEKNSTQLTRKEIKDIIKETNRDYWYLPWRDN